MHDDYKRNPGTDIGRRGLALFDEILKIVQGDEGTWNQGRWALAELAEPRRVSDEERNDTKKLVEKILPESCGTAYCVAGYAAHLTGAETIWFPVFDYWEDPVTYRHEWVVVGFEATYVRDPKTGERVGISEYARWMLGLTEKDSEALFLASNTLDILTEMRERWVAGLPLDPNDEDDDYDDYDYEASDGIYN